MSDNPTSTPPPEPERFPTGVRRLDFILKGGLLKGATYLVVGEPGSGKTVLGNQVAFHHAEQGGRAVYVTLLSENHARMLANIRNMGFFNADMVPERVLYVSGYQVLEKEGLSGLLKLLQETVRKHQASLLVLDGLDSAGDFAPSELSFKRFIHEQQAFSSLLACTTVLITPVSLERAHAESAAVDGVIELTLRLQGPRAVRELSVQKFRGSDYLLGRHEVELSSAGVSVHPRTEVQFSTPQETAREDRVRMPFGIPRLDQSMQGGLLSGSATTLLGGPGTGKTVLGLQFLAAGAEAGQPGVYFGFYEPPPRLLEKAAAVGIPLEKHVRSGQVEIQWQPPLEHNLDSLAERLLERIHERDVKRQRLRVVVDGVSGFRAAAVYPERMGRFLSALAHQLRMLDVTTLFIEETALFRPDIEMPNQELGGAVENVILLRNVELRSQLYRLISIMKMRESAYDSAIREFSISDEGIRVANSFASAESILSGQARWVGEPQAPTGRAGKTKKRAAKSPSRKRGRS